MQLLCFSQPSAEDSALQFSIFWCEMKVENRIQSIKTQTDAGSYETLTHTHTHTHARALIQSPCWLKQMRGTRFLTQEPIKNENTLEARDTTVSRQTNIGTL